MFSWYTYKTKPANLFVLRVKESEDCYFGLFKLLVGASSHLSLIFICYFLTNISIG